MYAGIVGIKGNDVGNSHADQLFQCKGTVQRFDLGALVLTALVEKRHDHADTAGLSRGSSNETLQILVVVVRGHVIDVSVDAVGQRIVADIYHDKEIDAPHGFVHDSFCLSGTKTRTAAFDKIVVHLIIHIMGGSQSF